MKNLLKLGCAALCVLVAFSAAACNAKTEDFKLTFTPTTSTVGIYDSGASGAATLSENPNLGSSLTETQLVAGGAVKATAKLEYKGEKTYTSYRFDVTVKEIASNGTKTTITNTMGQHAVAANGKIRIIGKDRAGTPQNWYDATMVGWGNISNTDLTLSAETDDLEQDFYIVGLASGTYEINIRFHDYAEGLENPMLLTHTTKTIIIE